MRNEGGLRPASIFPIKVKCKKRTLFITVFITATFQRQNDRVYRWFEWRPTKVKISIPLFWNHTSSESSATRIKQTSIRNPMQLSWDISFNIAWRILTIILTISFYNILYKHLHATIKLQSSPGSQQLNCRVYKTCFMNSKLKQNHQPHLDATWNSATPIWNAPKRIYTCIQLTWSKNSQVIITSGFYTFQCGVGKWDKDII